jgi:tetratricopeptide (TPR) repeat protein
MIPIQNRKWAVIVGGLLLAILVLGLWFYKSSNKPAEVQVLTAEEQAFFDARVDQVKESLNNPELSTDQKHAAYIDLGANYVLLGKFEDAKAAFETAVELKPEDIVAYRELWVLADKMGDKSALRKYSKKLAELDPENKALYERRLEEIK